MRIASLLLPLLAVLLALGAVLPAARANDDVLSDYKKRYTADTWLSDREAVLDELAASKSPKALPALEWCADTSREVVERAEKDAEKAYGAWKKVFDKIAKKENDYLDRFRKKKEPLPKKRPRFPEDDKIIPLEQTLKKAEKSANEERVLLRRILTATGKLVATLEPDEQEKVRERLERKALGDRDWEVRARTYEVLGFTDTPWAAQRLLTAALEEVDPRALARVLEALGGRKPELVLPVFRERLVDPRWQVRAAAVAGLAKTPSKETIDLLIETLAKEKGRLQDDCTNALQALTGADIRADADLWQRYWKDNRERWTGPPEPEPEDDAPVASPTAGQEVEEKDDARKTGFFGIDTKSRRLVYVIDVSGSMQEPMLGPDGKQTKRSRADVAKEELKRSILALEDGATFNIVFFSGEVKPWKKEMTEADSATRRAAVDYVEGVDVVGGTATFAALQFAFELASSKKSRDMEPDPSGDAPVDTIILLSDGIPSLGRYTKPDQIRERVRLWNEDRGIVIHTIAFGKAADRDFMSGLAEDTGGDFFAK